MSSLIPISLFGWIFVAAALFAVLPARRAVIAGFIFAWLFLPQAGIDLPGVPDLTKMNATSWGVLLGMLIFDAKRLQTFRLSWIDVPMLIWCLTSLPSSLLNELPANAGSTPLWEGISAVVHDFLTWGTPYLIGRLYFNDLAALRELAIGVFIGGLIYAPLCLFELRMSPQLHMMVYGFHPSAFEMTIRFGGYRPMVFMQHGLMLGMWMAVASLVGVWLWVSGSLRHLWNIPIAPLALGLVAVTIMCKSTGSIVLLAIGIIVLLFNRLAQSSVLIFALVAVAPVYMYTRAEGLWSGKELIELAGMINEERADSIAGRLENEDLIVGKAMQKPWFGWGGFGQWRVVDKESGEDITVSDGMWTIATGEKGLIGLTSLTALVLLPVLLLARRVKPRHWHHPSMGAPGVLAMVLVLYCLDNLLNAMLNPVYLLAAGGLSGFYLWFPNWQAATKRQWQAWMQQQHELQAQPGFETAAQPQGL